MRAITKVIKEFQIEWFGDNIVDSVGSTVEMARGETAILLSTYSLIVALENTIFSKNSSLRETKLSANPLEFE